MCTCTCKPAYSTSLTDAELALMAPLFRVSDPHLGGRPLKYDRRLVVDSILYVLASDCAWRLVPHVSVPWDWPTGGVARGRPTAPGAGCMTRCVIGSVSTTDGMCSLRRRC